MLGWSQRDLARLASGLEFSVCILNDSNFFIEIASVHHLNYEKMSLGDFCHGVSVHIPRWGCKSLATLSPKVQTLGSIPALQRKNS